jgi:hypothetical protein
MAAVAAGARDWNARLAARQSSYTTTTPKMNEAAQQEFQRLIGRFSALYEDLWARNAELEALLSSFGVTDDVPPPERTNEAQSQGGKKPEVEGDAPPQRPAPATLLPPSSAAGYHSSAGLGKKNQVKNRMNIFNFEVKNNVCFCLFAVF